MEELRSKQERDLNASLSQAAEETRQRAEEEIALKTKLRKNESDLENTRRALQEVKASFGDLRSKTAAWGTEKQKLQGELEKEKRQHEGTKRQLQRCEREFKSVIERMEHGLEDGIRLHALDQQHAAFGGRAFGDFRPSSRQPRNNTSTIPAHSPTSTAHFNPLDSMIMGGGGDAASASSTVSLQQLKRERERRTRERENSKKKPRPAEEPPRGGDCCWPDAKVAR